MKTDAFAPLLARIKAVEPRHSIGRVAEISAQILRVTGCGGDVRIGDRVAIGGQGDAIGLAGEVLAIAEDGLRVFPEGPLAGLRLGARVRVLGPRRLAPDWHWVGRVIDPDGNPLDGRPLFPGREARPLLAHPPSPAARRGLGPRLATGYAIFDTALPIVRGQRVGLFAGSGVGKSRLMGRLARGIAADVTVIALIGERGRELRDFVENILGPEGMARAVVIAATSDQPAPMRARAAQAALCVAEFFRDQGAQVLFMADSITRFAEAHREVALAMGETAAMRGFPPSVAALIMQAAERTGPGLAGQGDITAVFSVLVAGSDMEEPIADILRGVLDGHIILDRAIAERGRFPAVDLLRSVSRALPEAAREDENAVLRDLRSILGAWARIEMMVQAGLYASGSDIAGDRALALHARLDAFLAEDSPSPEIAFARLAALVAGEDLPLTSVKTDAPEG